MCSRRPRSNVHCGAVRGRRFLGYAPTATFISPVSLKDGNLNWVHSSVCFLHRDPAAIEHDAL